MKAIISYIQSQNEYIKIARYEPETEPIGVIQIIHGFGEHMDSYKKLIHFFMKKKYVCVIYDQKGHGEMEHLEKKDRRKKLGVVSDYKLFLEDVEMVRIEILRWYQNLPLYLFGHSMGGNIVANYLLNYPQENYKKVILETPWISLNMYIPSLLKRLLKKLSRKYPYFAFYTFLSIRNITDNKQSRKALILDKTYHRNISLRLLNQVIEYGENVVVNIDKIKIPVLICIAEQDKIVSSKATKEMYKKANSNITLSMMKNSFHSLHTGNSSKEFFNKVYHYLRKET